PVPRHLARGRLVLRGAVRACMASSPSRPADREARRAAARGFRRASSPAHGSPASLGLADKALRRGTKAPASHIRTHLPMCDEHSQFTVSNAMTTLETDWRSADRLEADDLLRFFLESSK